MLKNKFVQVCSGITEVKCSIIERVQRTIRERLYKYFTYKITHKYIDVIQKFVETKMIQFTQLLAWCHQKLMFQKFLRNGKIE